MLLNDMQIRALCDQSASPMISPFIPGQLRRTEFDKPAISSGLSSFGYDIRLAESGMSLFSRDWHSTTQVLDPKRFDHTLLKDIHVEYYKDDKFYTLPPHAYALGVSVETFNIPNNVFGICYCKSTYARCGLIVNTTPLEPGWRGRLVLEFHNATDFPLRVYANEGIAQVVFSDGETPGITYADRLGKYQDQEGITLARI